MVDSQAAGIAAYRYADAKALCLPDLIKLVVQVPSRHLTFTTVLGEGPGISFHGERRGNPGDLFIGQPPEVFRAHEETVLNGIAA